MKKLPSRAVQVSPIIHRDRPQFGFPGERRPMHPTERMMRHGRVRPMDEPGFFARLFGRVW